VGSGVEIGAVPLVIVPVTVAKGKVSLKSYGRLYFAKPTIAIGREDVCGISRLGDVLRGCKSREESYEGDEFELHFEWRFLCL